MAAGPSWFPENRQKTRIQLGWDFPGRFGCENPKKPRETLKNAISGNSQTFFQDFGASCIFFSRSPGLAGLAPNMLQWTLWEGRSAAQVGAARVLKRSLRCITLFAVQVADAVIRGACICAAECTKGSLQGYRMAPWPAFPRSGGQCGALHSSLTQRCAERPPL